MRRVLIVCMALVLAFAMVPAVSGAAPSSNKRPLQASSFQLQSEGGFGDAQNSYAWSMAEFNGDVYVGTGRLADTFSPMWESMWGAIDSETRPPQLPDVPFPPYLQDFLGSSLPRVSDDAAYAAWNASAHAEIWRLHDDEWSRVWRAADVPSTLLSEAGAPTVTPEITGIRSMLTYTDKNAVTALFASSGGFNFSIPASSTQLLTSTDGETWNRLKTPAMMGRQTRATAVHNGKLYVGGAGAGSGAAVYTSDEPSVTASWTKVLDFNGIAAENTVVLSFATYNGLLYVGTQNTEGFQVWRSTSANPQSNADWVKVVSDGAGDRYNVWAGTMKVFRDKLYVGSMSLPYLTGYEDFKGFDIIRIDKKDKWQLLVGDVNPVAPITPDATRTVASGWPSGFGNPLNAYCWQLEEYGGRLYVGTFDMLVFLRYLGDAEAYFDYDIPDAIVAASQSPLAQMFYGADMWETRDGLDWSPVTLNGLGDNENYGFRTMKTFGSLLYVGTSNPWKGCQIWTGTTQR